MTDQNVLCYHVYVSLKRTKLGYDDTSTGKYLQK